MKLFLVGQLVTSLLFTSVPAFALRQTGLEEGQPKVRQELVAKLKSSPAAGLEEVSVKVLYDQLTQMAKDQNWVEMGSLIREENRYWALGVLTLASAPGKLHWQNPAALGELGRRIAGSFDIASETQRAALSRGDWRTAARISIKPLPTAEVLGNKISTAAEDTFHGQPAPPGWQESVLAGASASSAESVAIGAHLLSEAIGLSALPILPISTHLAGIASRFARFAGETPGGYTFWRPELFQGPSGPKPAGLEERQEPDRDALLEHILDPGYAEGAWVRLKVDGKFRTSHANLGLAVTGSKRKADWGALRQVFHAADSFDGEIYVVPFSVLGRAVFYDTENTEGAGATPKTLYFSTDVLRGAPPLMIRDAIAYPGESSFHLLESRAAELGLPKESPRITEEPQTGLEERVAAAVRAQYGSAPYAIGIRQGGTNVSAGLVNKAGRVEIATALPETNWRRLPEILELLGLQGEPSDEEIDRQVSELIPTQGRALTPEQQRVALQIANQVADEEVRHIVRIVRNTGLPERNLKYVHIAFPGPVDERRGRVGVPFAAANIPGFESYPLAGRVQRSLQRMLKVDVKVDVENDASSGRKGEMSPSGTAAGLTGVVSFIWGTGMNADSDRVHMFEVGHALVGKIGNDGLTHYNLRDAAQQRPVLGPGEFEVEQRLGGGALIRDRFVPNGFSDGKDVTEQARRDNSNDEKRGSARDLIVSIGEDLGRAIAALLTPYYEKQKFIPNRFVLVSGVAESFGKGVENAEGRDDPDLLISAVREGALHELTAYFHVDSEAARRMSGAIVRTKMDYRREFAAASAGLPAAGLEEGKAPRRMGVEEGVQVKTADEIAGDAPELAAEMRKAGKTEVALLPVDAVRATPEPAVMDLYAHGSVLVRAMEVLPYAWDMRMGEAHVLPEGDLDQTNRLLEKADVETFGQRRILVIALDANIRGVQLPNHYDVALLLRPLSATGINLPNPAVVSAFLAQPDVLRHHILDLTAGTIQRVTLQGRDYYYLFA